MQKVQNVELTWKMALAVHAAYDANATALIPSMQ